MPAPLVAAALLSALLLTRGSSKASSFPHSGDPCKDTCDLTRTTCEKECADEAKSRDKHAKACNKECVDAVSSCQRDCPGDLKAAQAQMRDRKKKIPPPAPTP